MVGVAGKSKGCGTCRKRKIRCDEQRPACGNCIKAKRDCEGYDRPLVFISRGPELYRPEHTHSRSSPVRGSQSAAHQPSVDSSFILSTTHLPTPASNCLEGDDLPDTGQDLAGYAIQPAVSEKQIYDQYLITAFLHAFNPTRRSVMGSSLPWIDRCAELVKGVDNALAISLRSLALVRCARNWKDETLMHEGRRIYIRALTRLQAELNHESTKYSEEVMAACRILSTYEFLESTADGISGWITHMQGMERVVFLRGPSRFRSSLRSGALLDWRANAMIRSIIQRKASFLSIDKWQAHGVDINDLAERLYDHGFVLGALLEKADRAAGGFGALPEGDDSFNLHASIGVTKSLSSLDLQLDGWYSDLETEVTMPFWVEPDYDTVAPLADGIYGFPDLSMGNFVTTFWTFKLILSDAMQQMSNRLQRERDKGLPLDEAHSLDFLDSIEDQHNGHYRKKLAVDVIRAAPFLLGLNAHNPDPPEVLTGLAAAQRCLFTLGMSMRILFRFELGVEYARGSLLFAYIMPRVSFAQNLADRFKTVAGDRVPDPHKILQDLRQKGQLSTSSSNRSDALGTSTMVEFTRDGTSQHQDEIRRIEGSMTRLHQRSHVS